MVLSGFKIHESGPFLVSQVRFSSKRHVSTFVSWEISYVAQLQLELYSWEAECFLLSCSKMTLMVAALAIF